MKKRLFSFLMLLCFLAVSLGGSLKTANAEGLTEKTKYVAFGDSIAAGYGLNGYSSGQTAAPADSYQALLSDFLKTQSYNHAVSGNDSNDCIALLNSGAADADLKNADVISLSIGSNDLLLPFIQIVTDYYGIDPGTIDGSQFSEGFTMPQIDRATMMKYFQQMPALLAELADNATLHAQAAAFPEKLRTILSLLHQKAPAAEIYVTNIYDPFHFVPMLKDLSKIYIDEINQAFSADASDYTLIDVHTPFQQEELTNVHLDMNDPASLNADPHPSAEGHKAIAELFIQALKNAHTPKAAALNSVTTGSKYKLTAKIKFPSNADSCEILYATSKNGTYKMLASAPKKTFQTNSGKLKPGKTYYIKVRSLKTIKGVTYYGKPSGAKKVKIAK